MFLVITILCTCTSFAQDSELKLWEIKIDKIVDDVYYAYRTTKFQISEGNVMFVINEDDVVVFDSGSIPENARQVIAKIKELTDNPVSTLVISHGHEDHVRGIHEYKKAFPGIEVIAKESTFGYIDTQVRSRAATLEERLTPEKNLERFNNSRERLEEMGEDHPAVVEWFRDITIDQNAIAVKYLQDFVVDLPTETFTGEEITLYRKNRVIKILNLGHGKTPDDLLLYLPKEKILAAGDVVVSPVPFAFSGDPLSWADVLRKINDLDYEYIVPGHGRLIRGKDFVTNEIELVDFVNWKVKELMDKGMDTDQILEAVDLSKYEKFFVQDDPVGVYLFSKWYFKSHVLNRVNQLNEEFNY